MKKKPSSSGRRSPERAAWAEAARTVLTPLVRALVDEGLRHADIVQITEEALYAAARAEGARSSAAVHSRTGLPRSKAERISGSGVLGEALPLPYGVATRLISRWTMDASYSQKGVPRELPLEGRSSFATLCESVGLDSGAALRELKRVGVVTVRKSRVKLETSGYIPRSGVIEKLDILGRDGAEFLKVMLHNVGRKAGPTMLQRKASYDNIGSAALERLRKSLGKEGQEAVEGANRLLVKVDRDRNSSAPGGRRTRVSFGVYFFEEAVAGATGGRRKQRKDNRRTS